MEPVPRGEVVQVQEEVWEGEEVWVEWVEPKQVQVQAGNVFVPIAEL
jgi:hypothetical protein